MSAFALFVLVIHYCLVGTLCIYGAHRMFHTFLAKQTVINTTQPPILNEYPQITVQAPVFNERFVVERLIDALAALDYPRDKLQIQILDDSTDDSSEIAAARILCHRQKGLDITHICREDRVGFKAGALDAALKTATGEFIAIFDADFMPNPDFLKRAIGKFADEEVGMVQTRWHHLNTDYNILTRVQSIMLDAHFGVEQVARAKTGSYFNFNGTAGIWRRTTIDDAGGWRADTLTEDLDLSYRAQMKQWRFVYMRDHGCPSELPVDMCAFKTQQHRWAKGAIEVMKKTLLDIWKSSASLHTKIEASFHLTGNFSYMLMFIDSLFFLLPAVHIREQSELHILAWLDIPFFFFASLSHAWFFLYSQKLLYGNVRNKLTIMPVLLATSIGLGVNNGRAVFEALIGHVTGFVRTPKTGHINNKTIFGQKPKGPNYQATTAQWADRLEVAMGGFYLAYLLWAITHGYWVVTPFLALFSVGFFFTGLQSIAARSRQQKALAHA